MRKLHPPRHRLVFLGTAIALAGIAITITLAVAAPKQSEKDPASAVAGQASLTVTVTQLQPATFPVQVSANGSIVAWQEAIVGNQTNGLRLLEVKVDVGDTVRRGQPLAIFAADTVEAELAQSRAAVAEAQAALAEASANAKRAQLLQESGTLSAQQIEQAQTADRTMQARLSAARAAEKTQQLRLAHTRIVAPDNGVISARVATVGSVVPAGQELFRLIRGGRLEWRAEVAGADMSKLRPGQKVHITVAGGEAMAGRLRTLAPVVDTQTRNGIAYVDIAPSDTGRAGMFARGEFEIGSNQVMTLPQSAVQVTDGFSYVMRIGPDSRVIQTKVSEGYRLGDRVEITSGLQAADRVVVAGADFLGDGDLVRVTDSQVGAQPGRPARMAVSAGVPVAGR